MIQNISSKKKIIGNYIFMIGMLTLMMLNWNVYSLYQKVEHYNAPVFGVLLIVLLFCNVEIKSLIKDKLFYLVALINIISIINLLVLKTSLYTEIIIFDITLVLFLADKVRFTKKEIFIGSAVIAFFFIYWTIDVKGYFKGYSINLGGEILITGLMFLIFLVETLALYVRAEKLQIYVILIETVIILIGYKIISYYRSRTAFFVLLVFAALLVFEKVVFYKEKKISDIVREKTGVLLGIISVLGMAVVPKIYLIIGGRIRSEYTQLFFKQLFSNRFEAWPALWDLVKHFPITGIGTMYMQDAGIYRDGLLDTYNSFLDLLVVHGVLVCAGVIALLIITLVKQAKNSSKSFISSVAYIIIISMICLSYSENYILTVPFMGFLFFALSMCNSLDEDTGTKTGIIYYIKNNLKKSTVAVSISFAIAFLYFILGPIEIYYSNFDEFCFTIKDFLPEFILVSIFTVIISTLILVLFNGKVFKAICTVIFSLLICSYIQYILLNNGLMNPDGELKTADAVGMFAMITLFVLIAIIIVICILSILLKDNWRKMVIYVSFILTVMQVMAIVSLVVSNTHRNKDTYWLSGKEELNVAKNENIIVLMPDSFCRDVLEEVLEEYPDAVDSFNDFTYYNNVDSIYQRTNKSMIHMFTGEEYDESVDRYEWTKRSFEKERPKKFFGALKDKDYNVNLYTKDIHYEGLIQDYFDNVEEVKVHVMHGYLFKTLLNMSTYRYVPYVFKAKFYVSMLELDAIYKYEGTAPYWKNSDINSALFEKGISIDENVKNGLFISHFLGVHGPLSNDENGNETGENEVPEVKTYRGVLKVLENYISKLKETGKYDDSTIIIMGDHGLDGPDPVLFVKHKGETHDKMVVNSMETTFDDFIPTIINEIGGDYKEFGERAW